MWTCAKISTLAVSPISHRTVCMDSQKFWKLSKALQALPRRDLEETRRFPCFPTRRSIFMMFCDAVRSFSISIFDSYVQWTVCHFYFMHISAFFHFFCQFALASRTEPFDYSFILFCRGFFKILESPHKRTLTKRMSVLFFLCVCVCVYCSQVDAAGVKSVGFWPGFVKIFRTEGKHTYTNHVFLV